MNSHLSLGGAPAREARPAEAPDLRVLRDVSVWRIVRHDNAAFLLATAGTVLFAFALFIWITETAPGGRGRPARSVAPDEALALVAFTGALMALSCVFAGLRAWRVSGVFRDGELVHATVEKVSHHKGYTRLRLAYRHRGTSCSLRRSVRRSARARQLEPGDSLAILVDPDRPRRMVLAELFDGG